LFSSSPLAALIRLLLPLSTLPSPENSNKKPAHTHTPNNRELLLLLLPLLPTLLFHETNQQSNPTTTGEKKTQKQKKTSKSLKWVVSKACEEEWKKPGSLSHTHTETNNRTPCFTQPKKQKKLPHYYRIKHTEPAKNRKKGKGERGSNPPTTTSSSSP
jgi:hypothetical protein